MATKEDRDELIQQWLDTDINKHDPKGDKAFQGVTVRDCQKAAASGRPLAKFADGGK